eukprot:1118204-Prymnesium_polylepis.2
MASTHLRAKERLADDTLVQPTAELHVHIRADPAASARQRAPVDDLLVDGAQEELIARCGAHDVLHPIHVKVRRKKHPRPGLKHLRERLTVHAIHIL